MFKYFVFYKCEYNDTRQAIANGIVDISEKINSFNFHDIEKSLESKNNCSKCILINFILLDK